MSRSWEEMETPASEFFSLDFDFFGGRALTWCWGRFERYSEEDTTMYGQQNGRDPHAALFADFGPQASL